MIYKFMRATVIIAYSLIAVALVYGVKTDCANTSGYISCAYLHHKN